MAGADVIEAAIGITLLLLVSYVVLGGITTAASTVSTAKKDMTLSQEERLGTSIEISTAQLLGSGSSHYLELNLLNTGSQIIGDFNNTNVFITNSYLSGGVPVYYSYIRVPNTQGDVTSHKWGYTTITSEGSTESIHPGMLDPGETMTVQIFIGDFDYPHSTIYIIVTTPKGVSAAGNT